MRKYTVEKMSETRELITFAELNAKGEKIQIELVKGTYSGHNYSLPYLWKKHGYIDRILETYWSITTYATENGGKGTCWGALQSTDQVIRRWKAPSYQLRMDV